MIRKKILSIVEWLRINRFTALIILSIFVIPFSCWIPYRNTDVWYVQYVTLIGFFSIGISFVLWQFNKYIAIFNAVCWFNTIFVARQHPKAIIVLFTIHLACLVMKKISELSAKQRKWIVRALLILVALQGIYIIVQYLSIDPIFDYIHDRSRDDTVGLSGSHNQIGLFFSVTSPLVINLFYWLLPFTIFGLWCSTTTISWIAFIVVILCSIKRQYLSSIIILVGLLSIVYFVKFEDISFTKYQERRDIIKNSIGQVLKGRALKTTIIPFREDGNDEADLIYKRQLIRCNPLLGFGLSNFQAISPYTQKQFITMGQEHVYGHAHNDLIEVFFEMSWLGLVAGLMIIFDLFKRFFYAKRTKLLRIYFLCIAAHLINAQAIFTVHTAVSGMLLIIFIGLFEGEYKNGEFTTVG